jgi:hypothetical protein
MKKAGGNAGFFNLFGAGAGSNPWRPSIMRGKSAEIV